MREFLKEQKKVIIGSLLFWGILEVFTLLIWNSCYNNQLRGEARLLREVAQNTADHINEESMNPEKVAFKESRYIESILTDEQGVTIISTDDEFVKVGENAFDVMEGMENEQREDWKQVKNKVLQGIQVEYSVKNKNGTQTYILRRIQEKNKCILIFYLSDLYYKLFLKKTYARMIQSVVGESLIFLGFCVFVLAVQKNNEKVRKKKDEELKELADRDAMTHLLNKVQTREYINRYIQENKKAQGLFVIIDIDNFKSVNDGYGHAFGDEVILAIAQALKKEFGRYAYIGRIGGDEFVTFFTHLKDEKMILDRAERIQNLFYEFYVGQYSKHKVTVSMGGACYPEAGDEFTQLYKMADKALYETKKAGKNGFSMYRKEKKG